MKKEVLLFTSGLDSYIARDYLLSEDHDFDCLYFDHGGRYTKNEIARINKLDFHVIIDDRLKLGDLEQSDAHIPNRNILFTTLALSLGYEKVWLGGSLSDRVGDNKSEVYQRYSELLTAVNSDYCRIDSPFYTCYKDDMVRWWVKRHSSDRLDLAKKTFSCFEPLDESYSSEITIQGFNSEFNTDECLCCSACFRKCAVLWAGDIFIFFKNKYILKQYKHQFEKSLIETPRSLGTMSYIKRWYEELDDNKS